MSFKFTVHDVGHGQLLTLETPTSELLMWDCGVGNGVSPDAVCETLGNGVVRCLTITNYDEDHVQGLPNLREKCRVRSIFRNKSISVEQLRSLKRESGPISPAMNSMLDMHAGYNSATTQDDFPPIAGLTLHRYYNKYPHEAADTNNLSVLTIAEIRGFKVVITGDLEKTGWETLLRQQNVRNRLAGTNVFVASHHGRESGYHPEVMRIASPDVVVMSDYELRHDTQKTQSLYGQHCSGTTFNGTTRRVLTTRSDGTFSWNL